MKHYLTISILFICMKGFTQEKNDITIGKQDFIYSDILEEKREIWIYIPEGLDNETSKQNIYPVVYLLDGEYNFHVTSGIIEFLSKNDLCPQMILVGVINKNRDRDFSPRYIDSWPSSGGADNFLKFIKSELIPYINANYPTTSYKMLIGHSLSGGFVIYSMTQSAEIFNSYIAIDPSIHLDNYIFVDQMKEAIGKIDLSEEVLYLPYTYSDKSYDSLQIRNDTNKTTKVIRAKFEFCDMLDSLQATNGISVKSNFYQRESHSSLPLISIYDGLNYIFDFYKPPVIQNNIEALNNAKEMILDHYETISNRIGYKVLPPDNLIEALHYLYYINNMDDKINVIRELKNLNNN